MPNAQSHRAYRHTHTHTYTWTHTTWFDSMNRMFVNLFPVWFFVVCFFVFLHHVCWLQIQNLWLIKPCRPRRRNNAWNRFLTLTQIANNRFYSFFLSFFELRTYSAHELKWISKYAMNSRLFFSVVTRISILEITSLIASYEIRSTGIKRTETRTNKWNFTQFYTIS